MNQNIAQLCYDITNKRCDRKSTIKNLRNIFKTMYKWNKVAEIHPNADLSNIRQNIQLNECNVQSQSSDNTNESKETKVSEDKHLNSVSNCSDITNNVVDESQHSQEYLDLPRAQSLLEVNIKETEQRTLSNLNLTDCSNHLFYCAKQTPSEICDPRSSIIQPQR